MHKKMLLLINPSAGKGGYKNGLGEALEVFYRGGYIPTVCFTTGLGSALSLTIKHASDYDALTCIGGDGTLSDVISGLMRIKNPPPLGYMPAGTANDVASTLKLSRNLAVAAERIVSGKETAFDVGAFGPKEYFAYIAAFGAFTDVSYETPQQQKRSLGQLAYIFEAMSRLTKLESRFVRVEHDGGVTEGDFIFGGVTNSRSLAGVVRIKDSVVDLSDGLFELILIRNPKNLANLNHILSAILSQNYDDYEEVVMIKSRFARFVFDLPAAWTRDGENGGAHTDLEIKNRKAAIRFLL
ncbi:MAG: YegS/Rv2252/BmrU family lipid kinase [Oscillospiraceae bacterium]|nr:YegS/Rv2252/BmrU family lipid kinase [Oscillospiraceae bacterium]